MKTHSIMTIPIIGVSYKVKKQTTICRIKWINPATGNVQVTCGIATCNPDDKFDEQIGQRLSESRAKVNMYCKYIYVINDKCSETKCKHRILINKELEHQAKIKPSKENNM